MESMKRRGTKDANQQSRDDEPHHCLHGKGHTPKRHEKRNDGAGAKKDGEKGVGVNFREDTDQDDDQPEKYGHSSQYKTGAVGHTLASRAQ